MGQEYPNRRVTDEERREFLKALGITGAVAAGGVTLREVREEIATTATQELAPIGQAIQADLAGELNAELLAGEQAAFAEAATALPAAVEQGLPQGELRNDFGAVAAAGQPVYNHLAETGFFESTTNHLPEFTSGYLKESIRTFVGSEMLTAPLADIGLSEEEGLDLLATVVSNADQIKDYHWVATDTLPREQIEYGQFITPMTQGAAGGVLLWLDDLDLHLWQKKVLISDQILADATWHAHSMAAGFQLMTEGAKAIAEESSTLSNEELGALLSTGFAVQAIAQNLLPYDAYWITTEMRDSSGTDFEMIVMEGE